MTEQVTEIKCLDHGFVRLVDFMGSDSRVVDAARVSYQKGTKAVSTDRHLIRYLMRNKHTTPFEKVVFEFHVKCPMPIGEQWLRHRTGSFNKVSGRYSVMKDEFYIPELRKQSATNNQGASEEKITELQLLRPTNEGKVDAKSYLEAVFKGAYEDYELLVEEGVAKEQARFLLPAALYTEFYWTVNLHNLFHFLNLRLDKHAQYEIRVFAEAIMTMLRSIPELAYCIEAFQDYILDAPNISKYELEMIRDLINSLTPQGWTPSAQQEQIREKLSLLLESQPDMSKREKAESGLVQLIIPGIDK